MDERGRAAAPRDELPPDCKGMGPSLRVYDELELGRLHDWQVGGLDALEEPVRFRMICGKENIAM